MTRLRLCFSQPFFPKLLVSSSAAGVSRLRRGTWTKGGRFVLHEFEEKEDNKDAVDKDGDDGGETIDTCSRKKNKRDIYGHGEKENMKKLKKDIL